MSFLSLLLRNLLYHWRGNLAVFLGIALGSAVLAGALLVGDSLRGSLKALTLDQLGWVEEAMLPGRFFRADLANEIAREPDARCVSILLLQGTASHTGEDEKPVRVGKVTVLGIDASFWPKDQVPEGAAFWASEASEVVLNHSLAKALGAKVEDIVTLNMQKPDKAPREMLLGNRKSAEVIETLKLKVRAIVADEGMARFSLKPTPEPVRNAFVPMRVLQKKLELAGRANAILASGKLKDQHPPLTLDDWGLRWRSPQNRADGLVRFLDPQDFDEGQLKRQRWSAKVSDEDAALAEMKGEKLYVELKKGKKSYWRSRVPDELAESTNKTGGILSRAAIVDFYKTKRNYYLLESQRMILDPAVVAAAREVQARRRDAYAEVSVYLADNLASGKATVPYSIIAAVLNLGGPDVGPGVRLDEDEIVVVDWPGSGLRAKPDSSLIVTILSPNEKNHLLPKDVEFKVKAVVKLDDKLDDPDLTPEFPGITDQRDMANWLNPPFPYNPKRIKTSDEDYWTRYRTTPKAYVSIAAARRLWGSRFGEITSIRIAQANVDVDPASFPADLLAAMRPKEGGFVFQGVRAQALNASAGATDFAQLFLAFSFFLIVAALLLVGLLVRLNIDRRASEMGLLLATGWDHGRVRRLLLCEGAILALAGALVGLVGALIYGKLMLALLAANWPGGDSLNFLRLHTRAFSFVLGYGLSVLVSMLTLFWATRGLAKMSPRSLLSGDTSPMPGLATAGFGWSALLIPIGAIGAVALVITAKLLPSGEAQAGCFFGSGALLLIACLAGVWNAFKRGNRASSPQPTLSKLGLRNAGRHAVRSVLTVSLLASASFLIVAVESFHKGVDQEFAKKEGGSGGFAFYAEGSVPVFEDLDQPRVRRDLALDKPDLARTEFYPLRVQPGDDASCLNLYKPLKPRVMGVSKTLIKRGGFHFASPANAENPWLLLEDAADDAIPAILDANTAQWILKVKHGEIFEVNNDEGKPVKLRIVALLHGSIFQSEVLISEANFLKLYPRQEGFSFFLIDAGTTDEARLKLIEQQLGAGLDRTGLDVQTTASRLQSYLAVENTYLLTFQALGGLGLVLGAAGLAIVLLRGVWERRAELALLAALGFNSGQLAWLVLIENAFLLVLGLAAGTLSALLAVAPHLVGSAAQVLWLHIIALLTTVLAVGMIAAALAVWSTLRTPVLTALRRE